jgi:large-conductance mechanosensitive channel
MSSKKQIKYALIASAIVEFVVTAYAVFAMTRH